MTRQTIAFTSIIKSITAKAFSSIFIFSEMRQVKQSVDAKLEQVLLNK